jgi:hypothetical protein
VVLLLTLARVVLLLTLPPVVLLASGPVVLLLVALASLVLLVALWAMAVGTLALAAMAALDAMATVVDIMASMSTAIAIPLPTAATTATVDSGAFWSATKAANACAPRFRKDGVRSGQKHSASQEYRQPRLSA